MPDKEKDLAKQLAYEEAIKQKIAIAILNDEETVSIGDDIVLELGKILETETGEEYNIALEQSYIGKAVKDKKTNRVNIYLNMKMIEEKTQSETRKRIKTQNDIDEGTVDSRDSRALELEAMQGLKNGNAVRMEIDREISSTENMRMFVKRAWGIDAVEIYEVKDKKDRNAFKYVAKTEDGSYKKIDLSTRREGTNSRQQIWVMNNGKLEKKTVNSLLMKGEFAIATDVADNVATKTRTRYLVQRTPRGEYIAIAAGQKSGVNRNTTGDKIEKDFMSRENSVYDLEYIIKAALLAEKMYGFNKDGKLTSKEVEIVRTLKIDKNMNDEEVRDTVETIVELQEMGYDEGDIEKILTAKSKKEILDLVVKVDDRLEDDVVEKKDIIREDEEEQKLPGGGTRNRGGGNPHEE